ncbi:MAG: hypothetical protein ACOX7P_03465 [Oscillospiraceae bacterium]|jgi:hypothetical protein
MRKIASLLRRSRFLIALIVLFIIADTLLGAFFDKYTLSSGNFWLNDYEITRRDHPEEIWDRVFFGNSAVISGYREDLSESGYINFGVDYGTMTALLKILRSNKVKIGSELVIGINWALMFDNMETNPNYFWNRRLEPYSYFQRDRIYTAITGKLKSLVTGGSWAYGQFRNQTKTYYYSCLSASELNEKAEIYAQKYWSAGIDGCGGNLSALVQVARFCEKNGIRLRAVMMPWNPSVEKPEVIRALDKRVADICEENNVELLEFSDEFDAECFYDLGHMNYEYGSRLFTEVIDAWLIS